MTSLSQQNRLGLLDTPLGQDELVVVRMDATEGLGELFEFRIEALSENGDIDFDQAIGENLAVTLHPHDADRFFNGVIVEAQWIGVKETYFHYRLVVRPWLWLLSKTADCRIFSNQTAPDIIKRVFSDRGFNDFEFRLNDSYPQLEYCVQYRETDLAFVSRLMEQHGIYYFFEHSQAKHMLVLADGVLSHKPIPGGGTVKFVSLDSADRVEGECIYQWTSERRFRTGKVELNDYDFKKPGADLKSDATAPARYTHSGMEFYDYPGKYDQRNDGDRYARVCLEAEQALDNRRYSSGDAASLFPGGLVKLKNFPKQSENIEYLVVRSTHVFATQAYRSGQNQEQEYHGTYEFLPKTIPFRSPLVTPKPLIHGVQTAKVVGKEGEEIDVDEYGRILVEFFWVRPDKQTGKKNPSRRVRVGQVWSSNQWGGQVIPRIGMEVIVEFLEGDPDQPLVTGAVYNGKNKHPYELPANKTQSGVKSDSSKGHNGYNEFMFEDLKGSEFVRFHAERNLNSVIKAAETRSVGGDQTVKIGHDRDVTIQDDDTLTVTGRSLTTVGGAMWELDAANDVTINGDANVNINCGGSSILMSPGCIVINTSMLTINAFTVINGQLMVNGPGFINGTPIV